MKKININEVKAESWQSPKGKYASIDHDISVALGRKPTSLHLVERHPFDVAICRIPPGKSSCPYHSHSAQFEYYQVLSGKGLVRDSEGLTPVFTGDAFIFKPDEPHQLQNNGDDDFVILIVADNPIGESCYYPDSKKWMVRSPSRPKTSELEIAVGPTHFLLGIVA